MLSKIAIGDDEEYLVISCVDDLGNVVDPDTARRFFGLDAKTYAINETFDSPKLGEIFEMQKAEIMRGHNDSAEREFDAEVEKFERWCEDQKGTLERDIENLDKEIRDLKKEARAQHTLEEKIKFQRMQKEAESKRMNARRKLFDAQDAIDRERDRLIENAEKSLQKRITSQIIFAIDWRIV